MPRKKPDVSLLTSEEARKQACIRCMHLLEYQDRTEKQLRDRLTIDGFSEEAVEAGIAYVKSYHYLDDARFARNYIETRSGAKGVSRLRMELMQKGVATNIIDEVLEESLDKEREAEGALALASKLCRGKDLTDPAQLRKILSTLMRRGYSYDLAKSSLENVLSDESDDE